MKTSRPPTDWNEAQLVLKAFGEIKQSGHPGYSLAGGTDALADEILGVALSNNLDDQSLAILFKIYCALRPHSTEGEWRLTLKRRSPGKPSNLPSASQQMADATLLRLYEFNKERLGKSEAAVTSICHALKMPRSTFFEWIERAKKRRATGSTSNVKSG